MVVRAGGKTSFWLPVELAGQLAAWENVHGDINLSELVGEAIRRKIGQQTESEAIGDRVGELAQLVRSLDRSLKATQKEVRQLKRAQRERPA